MKIYIPTFRRVDNQKTFNNLPDKYKEKVIMVVQEQERDEYKYDCEYLVVGNNIGIAKTREIIYRHAGKSRFGMLDDDTKFFRRNMKYYTKEKSNMDKSKRLMLNEDWDYWFSEVNNLFDNSDIMHIGHRELALPPMGVRYYYNKVIVSVHWLDGNKLMKFIDDVDWNYVKVGEDSLLNLECSMRGYKNVTSDEIHIDAQESVFEKGGCAEFRDSKVDEEEHIKLTRKYPFVIMTNKYKEKKHIGRLRVFKIDIKKAYKSSKMNTLEQFL